MPDIAFLGTSAALPTKDRGYTSLAIIDEQVRMLVDCGAIVYQALLRADLDPERISDLFITHAHIDHIGGLPSFLECLRLGGRRAPLRVWALPETMVVVDDLLKTFAFEIPLPLSYGLTFHKLEGDGACPPFGSVSFDFLPVEHSVPTAGLRLRFPRADGKAWTVVYSSDTRPTAALEHFAQGCDLLILECTFLNNKGSYAEKVGHMTAGQAGELAHKAGAGALALVHLGLVNGWDMEEARKEASAAFGGSVIFPKDSETLSF
jgi:ribonuclease Z